MVTSCKLGVHLYGIFFFLRRAQGDRKEAVLLHLTGYQTSLVNDYFSNMASDGNLNVLCVNVRDLLQSVDRRSVVQNIAKPSRQRKAMPSGAPFNAYTGRGYLISGDSKTTNQLTPQSPADGAILEAILKAPAQKKHHIPHSHSSTSRFSVVPPPPKPHEVSHGWLSKRSTLTSLQSSLGKDLSPVNSGFAPSRRTQLSTSTEVDSLQSAIDARRELITPRPPSNNAVHQTKYLSPVASEIIKNTMNFLDRYHSTALDPEPEEPEVAAYPMPSTALPSANSSDSSSESETSSISNALPSMYQGNQKSKLRKGVSSRGLPVDEPLDWDRPTVKPAEKRVPFRQLMNGTFEYEEGRIADDRLRRKEMNIKEHSMKSHRPRYKKPKANLSKYGLNYDAEEVIHRVPGPFKKFVGSAATRRPKHQ